MRLKKILSLVTAISTMLVTSSYQIAFAESDFTSESKISEELAVNADVSATSVVLVYQAMSRADYLKCTTTVTIRQKPKHRKIQTGRVLPSKKYSRKCWQIASKHMHCKHWQI